jgi:hypothetical protein
LLWSSQLHPHKSSTTHLLCITPIIICHSVPNWSNCLYCGCVPVKQHGKQGISARLHCTDKTKPTTKSTSITYTTNRHGIHLWNCNSATMLKVSCGLYNQYYNFHNCTHLIVINQKAGSNILPTWFSHLIT